MDVMLSCPKKYQLRKVVRVEERPSFASIGGSAFHTATEAIDRLLHAQSVTLPPREADQV